MLRKIRKNEFRQAARLMAESFLDYPLYGVFFPDDDKKLKRIYYFFWFRLYTRQKFTYVSDGLKLIFQMAKPGDRTVNPIGLILNPAFAFGFLRYIPLSAIKLVREYGKLEEQIKARCFNPETDVEAQTLCVCSRHRGTRLIFDAFRELDDGVSPVFCQTHTERNARLYKALNFELCEETSWHGVTHYALKSTCQRSGRFSVHAGSDRKTAETAEP